MRKGGDEDWRKEKVRTGKMAEEEMRIGERRRGGLGQGADED